MYWADVMILRASTLCLAICWRLASGSDSAEILPDDQFETLSYARIVQEIQDLAADYPHLAQVYSAQERYKLPSPGSCSKDGKVECEQWVLHISDHATLKEDPGRPEVFFSGCLHGDEQVGPTTVVETAKLMVYAAICQADPAAKECDDVVLKASPKSVPWLARLALSRSTVFIPMTNSIGYFQRTRTENGLDPNRDFPYHQAPTKCMTTITARVVNEVWREHVFQLAVTFHGGMVGMAYEWGTLDHPHKKDKDGFWQDVSPDDGAQEEITTGLSDFAGSFKADGRNFPSYPTGRMNKLVYPVAGGMEDWAYAGSWGDGASACKPTANGGYPEDKTSYNSATLRAFNILVEASNTKAPQQSLLGSRQGLLDAVPSTEKHANGHISRNIRLSLMVVDLVQPYVQWASREAFPVDATDPGAWIIVADEKRGVDLEWTVGGAFHVDSTQLVWGTWPPNADTLSPEALEDFVTNANIHCHSQPQSGISRWGGGKDSSGEGTLFRDRIELDAPEGDGDEPCFAGDMAFVVAVATVDQSWGDRAGKVWPDVGPQSHLVNARTSEDWFEQNAGHIVRGRVRWLSAPLVVVGTSNALSAVVPNGNNTGGSNGQTSAGGAGGGGGDEGGEGVHNEWEGLLRPQLSDMPPMPGPTEAMGSLMPEVEEGKKSNILPFTLAFFAIGMLAFGLLVRSRRNLSGGAINSSAQRRPRRGSGLVPGTMEGGRTLSTNRAPADQRQRRRHQDNFAGEGGAIEMRGLLSPIDEAP